MSAENEVTEPENASPKRKRGRPPKAAPVAPEMKLAGRAGKRRDPAPADILGMWKTDVVDNQDPDYRYQFVHEDNARSYLRSRVVELRDFETGETERKKISAWAVVHEDNGPEVAAGLRPDEGKAPDTVLRHGPMVCLKIHKDDWALLERSQTQRADAFDVLMQRGRQMDFNEGGQEQAARGPKPRFARVTEEPFKYAEGSRT